MREKFIGEGGATEKHETKDKHEYMMLKLGSTHQQESAQNAMDKKAEAKAKALQDATDSRGQLADATSGHDAEPQFLRDTSAICTAKSSELEDRQKLRREEIEALNRAVVLLGAKPKNHFPPTAAEEGCRFCAAASPQQQSEPASRRILPSRHGKAVQQQGACDGRNESRGRPFSGR